MVSNQSKGTRFHDSQPDAFLLLVRGENFWCLVSPIFQWNCHAGQGGWLNLFEEGDESEYPHIQLLAVA